MGYMVLVNDGHAALATAVKNSTLHLAWGDHNNELSAPTGLVTTPVSSGGTMLSSDSYEYTVTAVNYFGQTLESLVATAVIATDNSHVELNWNNVSGASSYNVYRGSVSGNNRLLLANTVSNTYNDTGIDTGIIEPPTVNTTSFTVWSDTPTPPNVNHNQLYKEVGRREVLIKKYVIPDVGGAIVTSQGRWTEVVYPTKYLYIQVAFDFSEAASNVVYQFAVFINTIPTVGNENALYLLPSQIQNPGSMISLENTPPIYRNSSSRVTHEVVMVF